METERNEKRVHSLEAPLALKRVFKKNKILMSLQLQSNKNFKKSHLFKELSKTKT